MEAIGERVSSSQKQTKAATSFLASTINDRFTSDDKMLSALTKLSSRLESSTDDQFDPQTIEKWCTMVVSLRAASIRTRVDRIFKETLLKCDGSEKTGRPEEEALAEKEALKEEIETLHAEISSVAQMGVEQELRGPILQTLEQGQGQQKRLQTRWLDYASPTMPSILKNGLSNVTSDPRLLGIHNQPPPPLRRPRHRPPHPRRRPRGNQRPLHRCLATIHRPSPLPL